MTKHWAAAAAAVIAISALAGCSADDGEAVETPVETPNPAVTESVEPTAEPTTFALPTTCAEQLPAERIATFESQGLVLLGGPGGRYDPFLSEPTPEEAFGGVTCFWGDSASESVSISISVAPLEPSSRAGLVQSFIDDGLNEGQLEGATTFWVQGDTELLPAVYNVLRNESWISVIATVGGEAAYAEAVIVADEVATTVYR